MLNSCDAQLQFSWNLHDPKSCRRLWTATLTKWFEWHMLHLGHRASQLRSDSHDPSLSLHLPLNMAVCEVNLPWLWEEKNDIFDWNSWRSLVRLTVTHLMHNPPLSQQIWSGLAAAEDLHYICKAGCAGNRGCWNGQMTVRDHRVFKSRKWILFQKLKLAVLLSLQGSHSWRQPPSFQPVSQLCFPDSVL